MKLPTVVANWILKVWPKCPLVKVGCPLCWGDGEERCENPDHGFISACPGDIGRIGCPGCGHDPYHRVPNGGSCRLCGGSGLVWQSVSNKWDKGEI